MRALPPELREARVPRIDQATIRNRLLAALPSQDFAHLAPVLEPAELAFKQVLHVQDQPIGHVHFPEAGMVSMIAPLEDGEAVEVGLSVLLGEGEAGTRALVQTPGTAGALGRRRSRRRSTARPGCGRCC